MTFAIVAVSVDPVSVEKVENARPGTKILDAVIVDAVKLLVNCVEPVIVENNIVDAVIEETVIVHPERDEKVENASPGTKILDAVMEDAKKLLVNCVEPINDEKLMFTAFTVDAVTVELIVREFV